MAYKKYCVPARNGRKRYSYVRKVSAGTPGSYATKAEAERNRCPPKVKAVASGRRSLKNKQRKAPPPPAPTKYGQQLTIRNGNTYVVRRRNNKLTWVNAKSLTKKTPGQKRRKKVQKKKSPSVGSVKTTASGNKYVATLARSGRVYWKLLEKSNSSVNMYRLGRPSAKLSNLMKTRGGRASATPARGYMSSFGVDEMKVFNRDRKKVANQLPGKDYVPKFNDFSQAVANNPIVLQAYDYVPSPRPANPWVGRAGPGGYIFDPEDLV